MAKAATAKADVRAPVEAPPTSAVDPARLLRIEHYQDEEPTDPTGYSRYFERVRYLRNTEPCTACGRVVRPDCATCAGSGQQAGELTQWSTIVFDSVTSMDILARAWFRYKLNPAKESNLGLHDTRPWRAGATDTLEENLYTRVGSWRTNVVVVAHIDEQKDEVNGRFVRNPAAPGRLSKRLPAGYSELYYMYVTQDADGKPLRALQTQNDGKMNAGTSIEAPDPSWPEYEALWANWPAQKQRLSLHCMVYGDPGVGKSTFAATWPLPMLVLMFDGVGKDTPYQKRGRVVEEHVDGQGTFVQEIEVSA